MTSTNGYDFILGEGVISWKPSKQTYITQSIMKVEFIVLKKDKF